MNGYRAPVAGPQIKDQKTEITDALFYLTTSKWDHAHLPCLPLVSPFSQSARLKTLLGWFLSLFTYPGDQAACCNGLVIQVKYTIICKLEIEVLKPLSPWEIHLETDHKRWHTEHQLIGIRSFLIWNVIIAWLQLTRLNLTFYLTGWKSGRNSGELRVFLDIKFYDVFREITEMSALCFYFNIVITEHLLCARYLCLVVYVQHLI